MTKVQHVLRALLCALVTIGVLLPATVASAEPSPQDVERQLDKAHDDLELIVEDFNRIGAEIKANQAAADAVNAKLAPMQARMAAARSDVARFAATAYKTGGNLANVSVLLGTTKTADLSVQMESVGRLARQRQKDITAYTDAKAAYDAEKRRLDALLADGQRQQLAIAAKRTAIEAEIKRLEDMEQRIRAQQASRNGGNRQTVAPPAPSQPPPSGTGKGAIAVRFAYAQLGKMYKFGAEGPNNFDCSGLTMMAWKSAGVNLPRTAAEQYRKVPKVPSVTRLEPGDLVFSNSLGHVAIFIGNGQVIHASRAGKPIAVAPLARSGIVGYGRPG